MHIFFNKVETALPETRISKKSHVSVILRELVNQKFTNVLKRNDSGMSVGTFFSSILLESHTVKEQFLIFYSNQLQFYEYLKQKKKKKKILR